MIVSFLVTSYNFDLRLRESRGTAEQVIWGRIWELGESVAPWSRLSVPGHCLQGCCAIWKWLFFPFSTPELQIIWIHPLLPFQETERPQPYLKWDRCLWNCGFKSIFQLSSFLFYTEQSNVSWLINALSFFFSFPRRVWYGSSIDQYGLQGYFCPKQNGNCLPPHKPSVTHTIKRTHKYLGNYSPFT